MIWRAYQVIKFFDVNNQIESNEVMRQPTTSVINSLVHEDGNSIRASKFIMNISQGYNTGFNIIHSFHRSTKCPTIKNLMTSQKKQCLGGIQLYGSHVSIHFNFKKTCQLSIRALLSTSLQRFSRRDSLEMTDHFETYKFVVRFISSFTNLYLKPLQVRLEWHIYRIHCDVWQKFGWFCLSFLSLKAYYHCKTSWIGVSKINDRYANFQYGPACLANQVNTGIYLDK